ncbi:predicted protein [Naegleria gruberi]|uniref:Predicted protein n=1 Tax=Naegleria gruberi TaxID=5762 RepID=D2VAI7_NAEGR|nr:uncharacterized protein NAEGRDRAFT_65872 [Naegleria gruberi]EFC46081.1 predicted protein [Naegleria gruberi]|eukprot:XP_002678825.1 predicted protein [Naegleria gruberi strain NEG-M]
MSQFERSLQCPICKEFMDNPKCVKTCNHFFCDLCISREFSFRNKCPVCKEEYSKSDIIKIPFVSDMMDMYIRARKDLMEKFGNHSQEISQTREDQKSIISESQESFDWSEQLKNNKHTHEQIQKSKLPPLCFSLLKNNQLKEYLKKYSLPLHGTREQMIWRIKEFILRYNSNIDRTNPLPEEKIINSIIKEEKEREQLKTKTVTPNLAFFSIPKRKSDSTTINLVDSSFTDSFDGGLEAISPIKKEETKDSSIHTIILSPDDTNIIILTPPPKEEPKEEKYSPSFVDHSPNKNKRKSDDDTPTKWKKRCTVKIRTPLSKQSQSNSSLESK